MNGVDRSTSVLRAGGIRYTRQAEQSGHAEITFTIPDRLWTVRHTQTLTVWTDVRTIHDAAMVAESDELASASAEFTADDVGTYVRLEEAGPGGFRLAARILEVLDADHVRLDMSADTTVLSATALVGTAHFTGVVSDINETPAGDTNFDVMLVDVSAMDHAGVCDRKFPRLSRPAENLRPRLAALFAGAGLPPHQILLCWPPGDEELELEGGHVLGLYGGGTLGLHVGSNGAVVSAATYTGQASVLQIVQQLAIDEGANRVWYFDAIGRLRMELYGHATLPQALVATPDLLVRGTSVHRALNDYACRVIYFYGNAGAYVVEESDTELAAVGVDRSLAFEGGWLFGLYGGGTLELHTAEESAPVYEHQVTDTACPDAETARTRAQALLAFLANRELYTFSFHTRVTGIEPVQVGSVTMSAYGVAGDHLVQTVTGEYLAGLQSPFWSYTLTVTNNTRPVPSATPQDFWRQLYGATA